jgi:pSer/pThr/pTyr-binding forkhead associated (FHA) protein
LELNSPSLSIGRDGTCNLVVPDKLVSRHHARLAWTTQGWVIYDQGSANGVYVNGQRVSQHTLRPGDQVQIGQTVLVFQISASQSRGTPGA